MIAYLRHPFGRLFDRLWRRRGVPDPDAFFADLRAAAVGRRYTKADRYRDFRAVFQGASTPEQGRRVLWQILEWAHVYRSVAVRGDPHHTYFRDGERNIGLMIIRVMHAEPGAPGAPADAAQSRSDGEN